MGCPEAQPLGPRITIRNSLGKNQKGKSKQTKYPDACGTFKQ